MTVETLSEGLSLWGLRGQQARDTACCCRVRTIGRTYASAGWHSSHRQGEVGSRGDWSAFSRSLPYVLPDGKFLGLAGAGLYPQARVFRWNADGSREDLSFGAGRQRGPIDLTLSSWFSACPAQLVLHARAELSVKGVSLIQAGTSFVGATPFGLRVPGCRIHSKV